MILIYAGDLPKLSTLRSFPIKGTNGEVEYVDICERITDCNKFGDILLESECGSVVTAINQQCRGDACNTNRSILDKWLKGNGKKKVTYERLIEVIKRCGYGILADQMKGNVFRYGQQVHIKLDRLFCMCMHCFAE